MEFTVIVPIYKIPESILKKCLDSIVEQTFQDFELILIDDGSPDNCGDICEEYTNRHKLIKVIHKKNEGVAAARNTGISIAQGDWIVFIDPDDWVEPNYLECFHDLIMKEDADIYMVSCFVNYPHRQVDNPFFCDNVIYAEDALKDRLMLQFLCPFIYGDNLCTADSGSPWAKAYRKSLLNKYNIKFDERLHRMEDNKFNIIAYNKAKSIYFYNTFIYHYRKSPFSGFSKFTSNIESFYEIFLDFIFDFIVKEKKSQIFIDAYCVKVLNSLYVYCKMKYFHKDNPSNFFNICRDIKSIISSNRYDFAIQNMNLSLLSKKELAFYYAAKYKSPILLWILFKIKNLYFEITKRGL